LIIQIAANNCGKGRYMKSVTQDDPLNDLGDGNTSS